MNGMCWIRIATQEDETATNEEESVDEEEKAAADEEEPGSTHLVPPPVLVVRMFSIWSTGTFYLFFPVDYNIYLSLVCLPGSHV